MKPCSPLKFQEAQTFAASIFYGTPIEIQVDYTSGSELSIGSCYVCCSLPKCCSFLLAASFVKIFSSDGSILSGTHSFTSQRYRFGRFYWVQSTQASPYRPFFELQKHLYCSQLNWISNLLFSLPIQQLLYPHPLFVLLATESSQSTCFPFKKITFQVPQPFLVTPRCSLTTVFQSADQNFQRQESLVAENSQFGQCLNRLMPAIASRIGEKSLTAFIVIKNIRFPVIAEFIFCPSCISKKTDNVLIQRRFQKRIELPGNLPKQFLILFHFLQSNNLMILDRNDPTGLGLFSRYARNHACRNIKNRPKTANVSMNHDRDQSHHQQQDKLHLKKKSQFDLQQSRGQREIRYRKQSTPAVGQYNPVLKKNTKMVWDILKIYHSKHKRRNGGDSYQNTEDRLMANQSKLSQPETHRDNRNQKPESNQNHQSLNLTHTSHNHNVTQTQKYDTEILIDPNDQKGDSYGKKNNSRYETMKTQGCVDMSRMTGRGSMSLKHDCTQSMDLEPKKPMENIRQKHVISIYFNKQIARDRASRDYKTASHDYTYDYTVVKPSNPGTCAFNRTTGRSKRERAPDGFHSYTHYEFDEHVWKSNSNVFPNTKKHVINFAKQTKRKN